MNLEKNAIEIRNMSKNFKRIYDKATTLKERLVFWKRQKPDIQTVLKNISLDIKKGETVALIGTNGSGKSTLLKLMTKILYPNEGTVETNGKLTSMLELGAGFHPDFTGRENIYFNASIFGLDKQEIDARIAEIIDFSELGTFIDNPVRTYSSGMYMRLAFSVAINVDAEILLIDEILSVGDQHFQDKCFDKLDALRKSDKTIVIVSHSLDVVKNLCDRAIWIYKGEFKLDGDPLYVIDEYLKQIHLDHKEEKKKAILEGKEGYTGTIFIDHPKDFTHMNLKVNSLMEIRGWQVSDCENSYLDITIKDTTLGSITRTPRMDVLELYEERYGAFTDGNNIGWRCEINLSQYEELIDGEKVSIVVTLYSENRTVIDAKELVIYLDEER